MAFSPYIAQDRFFKDFHFDFHITNEVGQSWYDGSPDQWMPEREWCASKIKSGMTVVDCGAHHGMLSMIFAHAVGPTGKVIAYEALPSNARVIDSNAELNHLRNIVVRPVGVGEAAARMEINLNISNTVVMAGTAGTDKQGDDVIELVRLDDDLPPEVQVDFLKIDVEGHDLHALLGMQRILQQRPLIDLELHNFLFEDKASTLAGIIAILQPLGYSWELLGEIGETPRPIGKELQAGQLLPFDNPHLFGQPASV